MLRHLPTAAFACFIGWIVFLADSAKTSFFIDGVRGMPHGDKLGHLLLFGILAWLLNGSLRYRTLTTRPFPLPLGSVIVAAVTTAEEFTQLAFPSRTFEAADLAAGLVGIAVLSLIQWRLRPRSSKTQNSVNHLNQVEQPRKSNSRQA